MKKGRALASAFIHFMLTFSWYAGKWDDISPLLIQKA